MGRMIDNLNALKIEYTYRNIYNILISNGEIGMAEWLEDGAIKGINFIEFDAMVRATASRLSQRLGAESKGRFIGLKMDNSPQWAAIFWAIMMAGYKPILLDYRQSAQMSAFLLGQSGAVALITPEEESYPGYDVVRPQELNGTGELSGWQADWADELALCTSGTTATSKIFVYDGTAMANQVLNAEHIVKSNRDIVFDDSVMKVLAFLPMHHIFGLVAAFLWYGFFGATLVFLKDRAPQTILEGCRKHGVTHILNVPLFWNNVAGGVMKNVRKQGKEKIFKSMIGVSLRMQAISPRGGRRFAQKVLFKSVLKNLVGDGIRFMINGGGHILPETLRIINGLGYPLFTGFGMTEVGVTSVETNEKLELRLNASVGEACTCIDYKIEPIEGKGKGVGELYIRGASIYSARMEDGVQKPRGTENGGWFATGDIGRLEGKRLWIEGRVKEIIINESGENVYPDELEDYFSNIPGIEMYCVLGIGSGTVYEDIAIAVQLAPDTWESTAQSVFDDIVRANEALPVYKRVRHVYFANEPLPLANGIKVRRQKLKSSIEEGGFNGKKFEARPGAKIEYESRRNPEGATADYNDSSNGDFTASKAQPREAERQGDSFARERSSSPAGAKISERVASADLLGDNDSLNAHTTASEAQPRDQRERSDSGIHSRESDPPSAAADYDDNKGAPENRKVFGEPDFDNIKQSVRAMVAESLVLDEDEVGDTAHFLNDLGGDSLSILGVFTKCEEKYNVLINDTDYVNCSCVNDLSRLILSKIKGVNMPEEAPLQAEPAKNRITDFAQSAEWKAFMQRLDDAGDFQNPFFIEHDSVLKDTSVVGGKKVINLGSYNYLGLSGHPETVEAAVEAVRKYGTSASGSRLLAGEKPLYKRLEREIADWKHSEEAIVLVGGHSTNVTFVGNFCGKNDLILYDALSHNSITQGCQLSESETKAFPHNDFKTLEFLLKSNRDKYEKVLLIVEGVYSMDGDIAPIPEFVRIKKEYGCFLMVDEAHSGCVIGENGGGVDDYYGLAPEDVDIRMGTLSKGLGTCGGYLAGKRELIEYLRYNLPGSVFSVGISPPLAAACLAGLRIIKRDNTLVKRLQNNIQCFMREARKRGLNTCLAGETAIIPVFIGSDRDAYDYSYKMLQHGVFVPPAVYPAVPKNQSRLRFCLTSDHSEEQIVYALDTLMELVNPFGVPLADGDSSGVSD